MIPARSTAGVLEWADQRTPPEFRDEMRIEVDELAGALTVFECRPPWDGVGSDWTRVPVARLRFDGKSGQWFLDCADSYGRFRLYDLVGPAFEVKDLLDEIDADPTGIFWG